jgi:plastocyanin
MKYVRLKTAVASATILVIVMVVSFVVFYPDASAPSPPTNANKYAKITGTPVYANQVSIQDYTFTPRIISITRGTTVIWTNNDTVMHSVVFDDHSFTSSGILNQGSSFSFAFDKVGQYAYHGGVYPNAVGKIIVTD